MSVGKITLPPVRKISMHLVTHEEVVRAADLWEKGLILRVIARQLMWSEDLLGRVIRLCRSCPDETMFGRRNKPPTTNIAEAEARHAKHCAQQEVVARARRAAESGISQQQWRANLEQQGVNPSTVKARRPGDYLPRRRATIDPTLALPGAS